MTLDDLFKDGVTPRKLVEAAELGLVKSPSVEHRTEPCGRGSGLAVVVVDAYGREHVYVTTNAIAIAEHIRSLT